MMEYNISSKLFSQITLMNFFYVKLSLLYGISGNLEMTTISTGKSGAVCKFTLPLQVIWSIPIYIHPKQLLLSSSPLV